MFFKRIYVNLSKIFLYRIRQLEEEVAERTRKEKEEIAKQEAKRQLQQKRIQQLKRTIAVIGKINKDMILISKQLKEDEEVYIKK